MQVDQKPFTRKKPAQLVYLELGTGNGGMLLSLSEDGFRFRAVSPVRLEAQMPFAFSLDGTHRLEGSGIVEDLEDDCKSGGMRFHEVSDQFRSLLRVWLQSDSAPEPTGREFTPASATPLDTMEKIRQDLRTGYAKSPDTRPAEPFDEPIPIPRRPAQKPSAHEPQPRASATPTENVPRVESQEEKAPEIPGTKDSGPKILDAPLAERRPRPTVIPLRKPDPRAAQPIKPHFTVTLPPEPAPHKAAPTTSAFLKTPNLEPPVQSPAHVPPQPVFPVGFKVPSYAPAPEPDAQRPYVPPLDESFEQAWERAKLTAPPESPHLSRAAAGSIIAIALAVILGALAFNFRQDIGSLIISIGHSISGQTQSPSVSTPADQSSSPGNGPNSAPVESKTGGGTTSDSTKAAGASAPSAPQNSKQDSSTTAALRKDSTPLINEADGTSPKNATSSTPANPPSTTPSQTAMRTPAESANASSEAPDSPTGEAEFNIARELLRGSNRQRDLPKAIDLLWSGVRKGYVPAEVTLADLFRRGDGVEKNCDQATVLLTAASRKGSTDARRMLEQMAEQGCQ